MQIPRATILIVDDEPNVLLTVEAILRQEGYQTSAVPDGAAAIEAIRKHHFDLVLTDLKMPGVDGLQVLQEVRNASPDTVTVMMTGYGSVDSALEAVQLGAYEYLLKPTEVAQLKAAVRRALERKRLSEMDTLYRISRTLTATRHPQRLQDEVADAVRKVLNLASACVVAFDRDTLPVECAEPLRQVLRDPDLLTRLRAGVVTAEDAGSAARGWADLVGKWSFVFVPGIVNDRLVCVLVADNGRNVFEFHAAALRFLQGLASQTALALENASLIAALQENNRELADANEKLRDLDQLKSQFLSVATHELRTPLSVILGYNAMLAESLGDRLTPEENETLHESVQACKRLIRLVNSMLDVTQIESGKMKMNVEPCDLRQIVAGVVALFQTEARSKDLRLSLNVPARLPRVPVDAERFEQVLVNLVGNALKFTQSGSVVVSVHTRPEGEVEVAVTDTGVGISAQDQRRIFDEFTQIRSQMTKRQHEGSGLGLAIARRIVEAHEGRIEVESYPGEGSTFRVFLPLKARREEAVPA